MKSGEQRNTIWRLESNFSSARRENCLGSTARYLLNEVTVIAEDYASKKSIQRDNAAEKK